MATKKKTTKKTAWKKRASEKAKEPLEAQAGQTIGEVQEQTALALQGEKMPMEMAPAAVAVEAPKVEVPKEKIEVSEVRCISCGARLSVGRGSVRFHCPNCAVLVGRCANCRALSRAYTCACGFVGP